MHPRLRATAVLLGLVGWGTPALAGPKEDAKRLYSEAQTIWEEQGDAEKASELFARAYALHPHPGIALAIARTSFVAGRYAEAIEAYETYESDKERIRAELRVDISSELQDARNLLNRRADAPAVVASPSTGTVTATNDQLARLEAIAAELAALSQSIQAAAPPEAPAAEEPAASPPGAAEVAGPSFDMDIFEEETRSVSRYGQPLLEAPATVSVITADDIRMSGATNIPDALRRVVGVDVMQMSAAQPDLSIRGFNRALANKVLVLVDGRSVYQDILATPLWSAIPVLLEEVERIEVVRGPASAVYGANAVTGVVNIITRTPGTGDNIVHMEGGSPGHARGSVVMSSRKGDTATRLSAGFHQTGRWSTPEPLDAGGPVVTFTDDPTSAMGTVTANGRVDRRLSEVATLSLSGGYAGGMSEFYVFGRLGGYAMDFDSAYARADVGVGPVHVRAFANTLDAQTGPFSALAGAESMNTFVDSDTIDGEVEYINRYEGDNIDHHVVGGVGYRYKSIGWGYLANDGAGAEEHHFRVFLQEEAAVGPLRDEGWRPVRLVGSLRYDRHPLVDNPLLTMSPRGAAVWRFADKRSARVTAGTAFRAPSQMESYLELYQPVSGVNGLAVRTLGNQDLVPERVFTVEAGLHDESSNLHSADVTVYMNQVRDLVGLTDVDSSQFSDVLTEQQVIAAGTTTFTNVEGLYRGVGAELDGRLYPRQGVDLYGNIAVGQVLLDAGGVVTPERSMSSVKVNAGVLLRTPWRTDVATHVNYLSGQTWSERDVDEEGKLEINDLPIPGRTVLVARVATRPFADEELELAFTGWNLLALAEGGSFQEHPLGQYVGPRWFGSATWRF